MKLDAMLEKKFNFVIQLDSPLKEQFSIESTDIKATRDLHFKKNLIVHNLFYSFNFSSSLPCHSHKI